MELEFHKSPLDSKNYSKEMHIVNENSECHLVFSVQDDNPSS